MNDWKSTRFEKLLSNSFLAKVESNHEDDGCWKWEIRGWVAEDERGGGELVTLASGRSDAKNVQVAMDACLKFWEEMVSLTQE